MITTEMIDDEVFESVNLNGNRVSIDMRAPEEKKSLSPTELLLSAVAACSAVDMVSMLKKRRKKIDRFTIETTGKRMEETPRYFTDIHCLYTVVSPDIEEGELHKIAALSLEKYCSVASSLRATMTFSVKVNRP